MSGTDESISCSSELCTRYGRETEVYVVYRDSDNLSYVWYRLKCLVFILALFGID